MRKAEWLLANHAEHVCRLRLLKTQLAREIGNTPDEHERDELIADMVLRPLVYDGMPRNKATDSKTEKIALTYETRLIANSQERIKAITEEIDQLSYYIKLYRIIMKDLSYEEKWIATAHYAKRKSLVRMLKEMPREIGIRSKSTLAIRCNAVLEKIEKVLDGLL